MAFVPAAMADLWGADVAVLLKLLAEQIKQYHQLKSIIANGKDQMGFMRLLNAGLENSMGLLNSLPIKDEKVLAEVRDFKAAMQKVALLYGQVPKSPDESMHSVQDQTVAESLRMVNSFKEFSEAQERNSGFIAMQARQASPKGAARMQAEASAEILRSLSQLLRLNTQMLKLQSESLAMSNRSAKQGVASFQKVNEDLGKGFSGFNPDMGLVRF